MAVHPLAARAFGAVAEDYERGRPGWPPDAVATLVRRFGGRTVLGLGAGTGKLTIVLAALADEVIAVEPVAAMRAVLRSRVPDVRVVSGTAEAIPLPGGSVDAAFVAGAFHWFDAPRATAELARVLRPGGGLALLWNFAEWESEPRYDEVHALLEPHRQAVGGSRRVNAPWREAVARDDRFEPLGDETTFHVQQADLEGLVATITSFSWIGGLPEARRAGIIAAVRDVLKRHDVGALSLRYRMSIVTTRRVDG